MGNFNCGGVGQICCAGLNGTGFCTGSSAYCLNAMCVHCGATGEHCCNGESCSNGGCCTPVNNVYTCVAPNALCSNGMMCSNASCGNCGGIGQQCCVGGVCTQQNTACGALNTCVACGGQAERCCAPNNFCDEGRACLNLTCQ
jgi:hypothetical protein